MPVGNPTELPRLPGLLGLGLLAAASGLAIALADLNALVISLPLLLCMFVMRDFRVGVAFLVVLMPLAASQLFPRSVGGITGLNPANLLLVATLLAALAYVRREKLLAALLPRPLLLLYVLPIVIAGLLGTRHVGEIGAFVYDYRMVEFTGIAGYLRDILVRPLFLVLFAFLVGASVARSRNTAGLFIPMLVAVWVMCLMAIVFFLRADVSLAELASERARGFFAPLGIHANDLGRMYAIAYALMLFSFAATPDPRLKLALAATMGVIVLALALTFSRGAFFGFLVVNALFLLSRRDFKTLILAAVALALLLGFLPGAIYERIQTGWGGDINALTAGRIDDIWKPLLVEFWHSPIWGQGLASILWSDAMRSGLILQVSHPHNAYLQALLDTGLLGLVLLVAYFIHVWRGFTAMARDPQLGPTERGFYAGAAAGLISFLIAGMAGSSLMPVPEQTFLWLAIGMMYGQRARRHVQDRPLKG